MMNLYSQSKTTIAFLATAITATIVLAAELVMQNWWSAGLAVLPLPCLWLVWKNHRATMKKIQTCVDITQQAANGQLDTRLIRFGQYGALGQLADNINHMLDLTEAFTKEANTAMEYANRRRYFRQIVPTGLCGSYVFYAATINKSLGLMAARDKDFRDFVNTNVVGLANTVSNTAANLNNNATSIAKLSADTSRESTAAAQGATQSSANVQAVAAAVEEFSTATREITQQMNRVADISRDAVDKLAKSDATVSRLSEATQKITGVLAIIDKIAAQTKLLALNATIEAARAGEMGKGFAIVASEVRTLAEQTATATGEISSQIADMQEISRDTVAAMQNAGHAIREISEAASTVASAAEEQKAASDEIARNLTEAVTATESVSSSVSKVRVAAHDTASGVELVSTSSQDLSQQAGTLLKQVDGFMAQLDNVG